MEIVLYSIKFAVKNAKLGNIAIEITIEIGSKRQLELFQSNYDDKQVQEPAMVMMLIIL